MAFLPKHFDLKHLELFVAVADTQSMGRAAARFGVTQAAVSQAIQRLERTTNVRLLDRTNRPFRLTSAGTFVLGQAREILAQARITHQTLQTFGAASTPELRLSIVDSFAGALMPDLLRELRAGVAAERALILSGLADRNLAALSAGHVDGVITADVGSADPSLPAIPLLRERLIIIAPPGADAVGLGDVARSGPFLEYVQTSPLGRMVQLQLRRLQIPLQASVAFDRSEPLVSAVADGQGWTIATPLCLLASRVGPHEVTVRPVKEYKGYRRIAYMARAHEMSDLHGHVARIARQTAVDVLPGRLAAFAPWLPDCVDYLSPSREPPGPRGDVRDTE